MNLTHIFAQLKRSRVLRAERSRIWAELNSMDHRDLADLNISSADFETMVAYHMNKIASGLSA